MSKRFSRLRKALRLRDRFTLLTLNAPNPHSAPYTDQMRRMGSNPRVL